ncbi:MAG TPA: preprotein translocase subunit YajC [Candidatus Polarisedimenticolia bacterium]|nr:preprotein translocase subunit YajC [Candidatus Polarisedimenticolia bacterium]
MVVPIGMMSPPQDGAPLSPWLQFGPLLFFFVVIYFLLIRPAQTRQKQLKKMLDALKPGDRVVTSGGIIGTVAAVKDDMVQLRIADTVRIDITRASVVGLHEEGGAGRTES